ncbi:ligand-dependent nuclear receptor corepressor-like protein isoform X4 [Brachyhypopomus gauderio]|uniref:ligand-dependent nuclear receptor corepressor-like protein isoform X4 n=1 Tax=Brachyhypopomus gauderio TaxID=698409 RepID=UPI004041AC27
MATQCRSSKCTAERKGFRRELDSWRYKLIHCVGFESILEGIYGPRLLQDLNIFDDCEPEDIADWSTDAHCSFCNLQLEKLSDHLPILASPGSPPPAETPPPQGLSTSDKLQCQADRFLHAVFCKKEFPESCDPSIPLAAQELMRKMIRQFAIEFAYKSQACLGRDGRSASSADLPKLVDPDGPLDLRVSRVSDCPPQEGVLDLSKKNMPSVKVLNLHNHQKGSGRPIREDCLDRSSEFAEGLLSKALKDIRSGSLDIHKAAILYGIPQKTLQLQTEALLQRQRAGGVPRPPATENGTHPEAACQAGEAQLVLQKVAAWARSQSDLAAPVLAESVEASSFLHRLTLQRVPVLRERGDGPLSKPGTPTPPQSPTAGAAAHIRIPRVRASGQPKPPPEPAGPDVAYHAGRSLEAAAAALHKLKTILPKQGLTDGPSGPEARLLHGDVPPPYVGGKNGVVVGGSVTASVDDCGDDAERRDKQPRKKRGRYRQYDHDILEEAIAMVMGGKMSVSKAQGIYGVPHSTLEYKVKERMGTLKTPPKKKLRLAEAGTSGSINSGRTTNASTTAYKRF